MYAVYVNKNKSVQPLVSQHIHEGYKLNDWFWILIDAYYGNKDFMECNGKIKFTLPNSKRIVEEKLIKKNELYEGYVKYVLSSKSKLTMEPGKVECSLSFENSDGVVLETEKFTVIVSTLDAYHDDPQYGTGSNPGSGNIGGDDKPSCDCTDEKLKIMITKILEEQEGLKVVDF